MGAPPVDEVEALMKILLIEDDPDIAANMMDYLSGEGHSVDLAFDGPRGLVAAQAGDLDIIIADVNLPGLNGFDLSRTLRTAFGITTPIIFTTARGELSDKLEGFEAGGWDYLVKPFSLAELSARLRALTLRQAGAACRRLGRLSYNPATRSVSLPGGAAPLPRIAAELLTLLLSRHPEPVSRDTIVERIWGEEEPDSSPLRSHVSDLRRRLQDLGAGVALRSRRGAGYWLEEDR